MASLLPSRTAVVVSLTLLAFVRLAISAELRVSDLVAEDKLLPFPISEIQEREFFGNSYYVELADDDVRITRIAPTRNPTVHSSDTVTFVATNRGEWGGELHAIREQGKLELLKGNIVELMPIGSALYILEGIAHLGVRQGSIHRISRIDDDSDVPQRITSLPDAPVVATQCDARVDMRTVVIVGSRSVMIFTLPDLLEIFYWDAFWTRRFIPNSVVCHEGRYFIGFPHGVAVLEHNGKKDISFYTDDEFFRMHDLAFE